MTAPPPAAADGSTVGADPPALDGTLPTEKSSSTVMSTVHLRRSSQALSRWPITLHPLKDARTELLVWWRALERRERSDARPRAS